MYMAVYTGPSNYWQGSIYYMGPILLPGKWIEIHRYGNVEYDGNLPKFEIHRDIGVGLVI